MTMSDSLSTCSEGSIGSVSTRGAITTSRENMLAAVSAQRRIGSAMSGITTGIKRRTDLHNDRVLFVESIMVCSNKQACSLWLSFVIS